MNMQGRAFFKASAKRNLSPLTSLSVADRPTSRRPAQVRFQSSTIDQVNDDTSPFNLMREHMQSMKLNQSMEPVPYTDSIPVTPVNDDDVRSPLHHKKVTVVGCGQVGMAIGYAILNQTICGTIALIDMNEEKLIGEAKDLQQGSGFHENVRIVASTNMEVSAHSDLVIVTAGVAQKPGESRLSLVERNAKIMQHLIPSILAHSPNATICIVSNPCDIMTAVAAKVAGPTLPAGRLFGFVAPAIALGQNLGH